LEAGLEEPDFFDPPAPKFVPVELLDPV